jgi:hypothetical protein
MTPRHQRTTKVKLRYIALALVIGTLAGVTVLAPRYSNQTQAQVSCSEKPAFEQTVHWLTTCLDATASAEDVERMLVEWGRIRHASDLDWGGVSEAHLLPDGNPQLIIRYYPNTHTYWDPQGKLIVLQRDGQHWRVVFDASSLKVDQTASATEPNTWMYNLLSAEDATGDGLDDLLVELNYSNGTHLTRRYVTVLTAHPARDRSELRVAFLQQANSVDPIDHYDFVNTAGAPLFQAIVRPEFNSGIAITRTYSFEGDSFTLAKENIDPKLCRLTATTLDGSLWCAFSGPYDTEPFKSPIGLYRVKDGRVSHLDMPLIHSLKTAPDGTLYVGAGRGMLRYHMNQWETLISPDGRETDRALYYTDIAFTGNGDVWAAGIFNLARFDGKSWTQYGVNARRLLVAPDGSLWTEGWDGDSANNCCFAHVTGNNWLMTYTYSSTLPVSDDLLTRIHELRN